jgi:hypothetical protein
MMNRRRHVNAKTLQEAREFKVFGGRIRALPPPHSDGSRETVKTVGILWLSLVTGLKPQC